MFWFFSTVTGIIGDQLRSTSQQSQLFKFYINEFQPQFLISLVSNRKCTQWLWKMSFCWFSMILLYSPFYFRHVTCFTTFKDSFDWIIESQNAMGWKGPLKVILFQLPCHEQGHIPLDQVAQSPVQPDLECFQGWGSYHLSGQLVPVFHYHHCKKFLP